jgi:hypothetical protein
MRKVGKKVEKEENEVRRRGSEVWISTRTQGKGNMRMRGGRKGEERKDDGSR